MNEHPNNQPQQLWQSQPVEDIKMSAEVIRKRANKFEKRILWRNVGEYSGGLVASVLFMYFFVKADQVLFRIAFGLFIAGMAWVAFQLHRKGSAKRLPTALGTSSCLQFFRVELERQRDAVSNVWPWYLAPLVPGFAVYTVAYALAFPRLASWAGLGLLDATVAALFVAVWKMNMRAARCLQRMIDDLTSGENQPQRGERM